MVALANVFNNAGGSLSRMVPMRGVETAVRVGGGVPWEVKVVGADIKWLVARQSWCGGISGGSWMI